MSEQSLRTCLIGGAGFIGRALTTALLATGRQVDVVDIAAPAQPDAAVTYHIGNYAETAFLTPILANVDEVVHLAYATVPKTSFDDPLIDLTDNLPPVLGLLDMAREAKLKRLVLFSSGGAVYGKQAVLPITEAAPTDPISPYGITKLAIEKYARMYAALYDVPTVILRPGNAYGEGQRPFTGQGFIATAIASILEDKAVTIYGEEGAIRDYVHVDDIASAVLAVLAKGQPGEVYNVGTGRGTSLRQVLNLIEPLATAAGHTVSVTIEPTRSFDVPANVLDATKLRSLTGWQPTVSLEDGLHRAWEWYAKS